MKTIDEQLNIINDTKNGIAQVLNSKGVEVTADTKFADYPDKVAQLMGNAEVDASVSAALTEVTAEYLEQVNAVKAQADGLEESKLDVSVAEATYQPIGNYLTEHQDISGKLDVSVAAETYQPKGDYLTEHQDISGKLDASVAEATYQPKGNYLTEHQDISGKLDASVAEATYQPKGNYQPAGNYLTEHQDISGKLDASVAAETYQPKGAYLTEHQSLADYALKSELPLVPTNVSAFTNDAGYLTQHQDISNLLDVSTAAETYATKSDVTLGSGSGATLRYDAQDGIADNDAVNGVSLNHIEVCLRFLPYDESEDVNYVVFHDTVVGNIYLWRIGSDWYLSQNDSANATERNYLLKGTATLSLSESYKDTDVKKYDVVFPEAYTLHADTVAFGSGIYIGTSNYGYIYAYDTSVKTLKAAVTEMMSAGYLTQHQDISGKLDASVAAETYQPKGAYLTEHQDISGKLDVSVAAETYATKAEVNSAGYLTSHQDISGKLDSSVAASTYATKSEIEGLGAETVIVTNVYGSSVDTEIVPQEMTSIVLKFNNSDMAPSDYVESFSSIKQATIRIPMRSIYWENQDPTSAQTVSMVLWYNDTEEAWYVNPEGAGYIDEYANNYEGYTAWYDALPISQWFDRSHSWKPEGNYGSTYYKANFTAEFEVLSDDDYAYQFTITFDHKRNIICGTSSTWFTEWRSQSVQRILSRELTMKQYVDGVAETKVSSSALSNYDTKTEVANTYVKKADNIHSSQTGYLFHRNMGGMKITFNGFAYSQTQDRPDNAMWNGRSQTLLLNTPEWMIMATGYEIIIRNATNENEEYTYSRDIYGMSGNYGPDVMVRKLPKTFTITVPTWTGYNDMFRFYLDVPYDEYTEIKADDLAASHSSDVSTLNAAISAKLDSSTAAATYATKSELTADSIYEQTTAETAVFNGTPTVEPEWNSGDAGQATGIVIGFSSDFNDYDLKFMGSVGMASDPYIRISNGYFDIYAQDYMEGTETVVVHTTDFTTTTDNGVTTVTANFGSAVDFSNTHGMLSQNMNNVSLFKTLNSTTVTVKQKIAQLEALIATLHPQS